MVLIIRSFQYIDQKNAASSDLEVDPDHNLQPSPSDLLLHIHNLLIKLHPLAYVFFNVLYLIIAPMLERAVVDLKLHHAFVVTFTVIDQVFIFVYLGETGLVAGELP